MSAAEIFIVRNDMDDQQWHVRIAAHQSGEKISSTEQLTRQQTAEENVLAQARAFGYDEPRLVHLTSQVGGTDDEALLYSGPTISGHTLEHEYVIAHIRYLDERTEPPC